MQLHVCSVQEGSFFDNFIGEPNILAPLYQLYDSAIAEDFINLPEHYTHAPSTSMLGENTIRKYDRKIDYLFTNLEWDDMSGHTHQACWELSDHMPISATLSNLTED